MKYDFDTPVGMMFVGYQSTEELTQHLRDIECSEDIIAGLLSHLLSGEKTQCLCQLEQWRSKLLSEIHKEQSCIAFLDEMVCSLKRTPE